VCAYTYIHIHTYINVYISYTGLGVSHLLKKKKLGVLHLLKYIYIHSCSNTYTHTVAQIHIHAQVWEFYTLAQRGCSASADRIHLRNTVRYCKRLGDTDSKGARLYAELARRMQSM